MLEKNNLDIWEEWCQMLENGWKGNDNTLRENPQKLWGQERSEAVNRLKAIFLSWTLQPSPLRAGTGWRGTLSK